MEEEKKVRKEEEKEKKTRRSGPKKFGLPFILPLELLSQLSFD